MKLLALIAALAALALAEPEVQILEGLPVVPSYSKNIIKTFITSTRDPELLRRQAQFTIPYNAYFASVSSAAKDPKAISSYSYLSVLYTANVQPNTLITYSTVVNGITITQNIPPYQPTEYCWLIPGNSATTPQWFKDSNLVTGDLSAYASWGVVRSACQKTTAPTTSTPSTTPSTSTIQSSSPSSASSASAVSTSRSSNSQSSSPSSTKSSDSSSSKDVTVLNTVPVTVVITQGSSVLTSTGVSTSTSVSAAPASTTSTIPDNGGGGSSSGGLSSGAKAGIGIGAVLGAIALLGLGFLAARHHNKSKNKHTSAGGTEAGLGAAAAAAGGGGGGGGGSAYAANDAKETYVPQPPPQQHQATELPANYAPQQDPKYAQYVMGPGGQMVMKEPPQQQQQMYNQNVAPSPQFSPVSGQGHASWGAPPVNYQGGGGYGAGQQAYEVEGVPRHELHGH